MKHSYRSILLLVRKAITKYIKDDPIRLSGTTAFFMLLAVAPIVIIMTNMAGMLIDQNLVTEKVLAQTEAMIGPQGREYIQMLIESSGKSKDQSLVRSLVGIGIFIGISTTLFHVVQNAINYIWRVRSKPQNNLLQTLKDRTLSFGLLLSIGLIMLITLLLDAGISLLDDYLSATFPTATVILIRSLHLIVSFGVATLIFALIYRFLPDARIKWHVTWIGALITAALFTIGKFIIGALLGSSGLADLYGAAGSIVIVLLWFFYSSIIFYFGAEITQQYGEIYAKDIQPQNHAVRIKITEVSDQ
ncbi:YihY/virulence factor BrkB family protein [Marinoscillum furvescens]|uniref:Membrane protein n=1 Tax=Marinoscillum furvescens DSM 4134 TaxID=1122208 RepID=A0A3D9L6U8_MARFU|nr:YihY/virulence factor BrkB family protein [Marinoscillum furvescens]REE02081.1 membrane protein [Marinoscillum furvescens DSM 4134]